MMNVIKHLSKLNIIQLMIFFLINGIFVFKYSQRTCFNPYLCTIAYLFFLTIIVSTIRRISHINYKYATIILLLCICTLITIILIKVSPLSINVDRWSATTYFLDALFSGIYPYGVVTHVGNYSSPFPLWHYLNIPFWILKDVGIGLFAFLFLLIYSVYTFTSSYKKTFIFLLLLSISPSYWWEIMVRSDGLSNQILAFSILVYLYKKGISFDNRWIFTSIVLGLCACTRLSAVIPIGIYLLKSYIHIPLRQKIYAAWIVLSVMFIVFIPYIFWDTNNYVFFERNPFMTQSILSNIYIVTIAVCVTIIFSFYNNGIIRYFNFTSIIMFLFFGSTLICFYLSSGTSLSVWDYSSFDISYLTLLLPYCITSICLELQTNE